MTYDIDLAALRKHYKEPWVTSPDDRHIILRPPPPGFRMPEDGIIVCEVGGQPFHTKDPETAQDIVAAHNALPLLCDEIQSLRRVVAAAREVLNNIRWVTVAEAGPITGPGNRLRDAFDAHDRPQIQERKP